MSKNTRDMCVSVIILSRDNISHDATPHCSKISRNQSNIYFFSKNVNPGFWLWLNVEQS